MPEKIKIDWTVSFQVGGGPKVSEPGSLTCDAYDKIEVVVKDKTTDKAVDVQPSTASGRVQLLLVKSDKYGDKLTYKVSEAATQTIKLDALQFFMGEGAVGLLGATPPQKLLFSNQLGSDASVEILVGRKATT
jgi:hypothetical protein